MSPLLLAALTAYSKTIDLILAVHHDMPPERRAEMWERHFDRLKQWDDMIARIFILDTPLKP